MKTEHGFSGVCPICGKTYIGHPALSRADNKTLICPDCGTREALSSLGLSEDEKNRIIDTIHKYTRGGESA